MHRIIGATLATLMLVSAVQAQQPERRASSPPPAPTSKPRIGHAASPPAPAPAPVQVAQPVYYYSPDGYAVHGAPYLALSDGSVLVNFGYGYERVLRQCAPVKSAAQADPWARDALGRIPEPPGIAALKAGTRGQATGSAPARTTQACYRTNGHNVEMVTMR